MNGAPPQSVSSSLHEVRETADLASILDPGVQACWQGRPQDGDILDYLNTATANGALAHGFQQIVRGGVLQDLAGLPAMPGREALRRDLAHLVELMDVLLGAPALGLRLEVLRQAMCPRFHVDRVGIRLLCTYRGPGTELLDECAADRRWLGIAGHGVADEDSGLIRDPGAVRQTPPFAVLLMKGAGWPGNERFGAIHRSPSVVANALPRVMVALDAIWE